MTAEIVVMNKGAIALAADSAVTITTPTGDKTYNTVNKLFVLSKYRPVGIMVYGNAGLMGVPWETLIKTYRAKLYKTGFPTVMDYAKNFLQYLNETTELFPESEQIRHCKYNAAVEFHSIKTEVEERVAKIFEAGRSVDSIQTERLVAEVIDERHAFWEGLPKLATIPEILDADIPRVYKASLDKIITDVFESLPIPQEKVPKLAQIVARRFTRDYFPSGQHTGLVIAGFGEEQLYPSVVTHLVSGVIDNKLRYKHYPVKSGEVDHNSQASIIPFAQSEMVDRFMTGVDPDYKTTSDSYIEELINKYPETIAAALDGMSPSDKSTLLDNLKQVGVTLIGQYHKDMQKYRYQKEISPILDAVEALPKDELALMAESLVNLTSLKRKVSLGAETVGGAIDVAVISKGDGLIWIKRKHYFNPELNNQFFQNYYRKDRDE
jgi:hypothetical protein